MAEMNDSVNVFGEPLEKCSDSPITGYFRDSLCNTCDDDVGLHTVCVIASEQFLEYSRSRGNDLSTPLPEYDFDGLKPGNAWCLCAARWLEAYKDGKAPNLVLSRTHMRTLEVVPMELLKQFAVDLN